MAAPTINWPGKSGNSYTYWIFPIGTNFRHRNPGNYAFTKETRPGFHQPLYFGETGDLSERFDSHHAMERAQRLGVTHIHVHISDRAKRSRCTEEGDLIAKWNPPLNVQHRTD